MSHNQPPRGVVRCGATAVPVFIQGQLYLYITFHTRHVPSSANIEIDMELVPVMSRRSDHTLDSTCKTLQRRVEVRKSKIIRGCSVQTQHRQRLIQS